MASKSRESNKLGTLLVDADDPAYTTSFGGAARYVRAAWGMPDGMFSGLFGEWWYEGDTQITVFYQNSPEAPEPVIREVSVQLRETPKT